jgi:hypothetical protein
MESLGANLWSSFRIQIPSNYLMRLSMPPLLVQLVMVLLKSIGIVYENSSPWAVG